ncbi:MAG TPA: sigma-54 dependent transcriptional regulator [Methylomirabilota bacterium]|nr:sigma-54 dependent transcriptional regulator [Methylomirabilota bacterium]
MNPGILIADDEESLRWVLERGLRQAGYEVTAVADGEAAIKAFEADPVDLVFLDIRMPRLDGLTVLERLRAIRPDACVVVMTAHGTMDTAIKAMQRGAYDYLAKPFDLEEVLLLTERALTATRLSQEVTRLRRGLEEVREFSALIGRHPRMQDVYKTIGRIAGTDVTVLLRGESGTGKELVARAVHHYSRRSGRPFVAVSCAAIPITLLESEMFGHERGAFTDAKERRLGKFELAHGGTLYLDEIGDMPLELQSKLLRALQERVIERVGGREPIPVDVRVLAATHRDLESLMQEGRFREDLYYRLNVVTINLPPLRERRRDIPLLVEHFLAKYAEEFGERAVAPDTLDRLVGYGWPGNVRELENIVQRAMVLATTGVILPEHLPIGPVSAAASVAMDASLEDIIERKLMECVRGLRHQGGANLYGLILGLVEKPLLRAVLRETGGNQVRAAQILGINRNTLRKKLTEHGIHPEATSTEG